VPAGGRYRRGTISGQRGMATESGGTNGGQCVTSGDMRRRRLLFFAAGLAFALVQVAVNGESAIADLARSGRHVPDSRVWIWEWTSLIGWIAMGFPIWWLVRRVRPPRFTWPVALALHAAATVAISVTHVLVMIGLRKLIYLAIGDSYDVGDWLGQFVYEYRKDAATYILIALYCAYGQWLFSPRAAASEPQPASEPRYLQVTDGSVMHRVPIDAIDHAGAAGNYVEIAWEGRTLLHRSTLAALADELGPGFVRIHRGRLVRRAAIRSVETDRSGDFSVTLADGTHLRGSRRYREGL